MSVSISRIAAISGAAAALYLTGYAIYFDYRRRHNSEFRRKLRKQHRRQLADDEKAQEAARQDKLRAVGEALTKDLASDPLPTAAAEREASFAKNVELGERLAMTPGQELESACKFYKALSVYPNPADLLGIYQRNVPESVYEYIVLMLAVYPPTNIASIIQGAQSTGANATAAASEAELAALSQANDIDE